MGSARHGRRRPARIARWISANLDAMRGISAITASAVYGRARKPLAG